MHDTANTERVAEAMKNVLRDLLLGDVDFWRVFDFSQLESELDDCEGKPIGALTEDEKILTSASFLAKQQRQIRVSFLMRLLRDLSVLKRLSEEGIAEDDSWQLGRDFGIYLVDNDSDECQDCPMREVCPQGRRSSSSPFSAMLEAARGLANM